LFFNIKSRGSGLCITGLWVALGPWWTHNHRVAQPLRDSGGRRDSLEREKVIKVFTNDVTCRRRWLHDGVQQRRMVMLQWGDDSRREEERLELVWVRWIMKVLLSRLL
jgi:hypothetical protein